LLLTTDRPRQNDLLLIIISYFSFIVLGIPGAMINVAWDPYMRDTFQLPLDAVGSLFLMSTTTYTIFSFISGRLINRFGLGRLMVISGMVGLLGLLMYVVAPAWPLIMLAALVAGAAGGTIDASMNILFAANYGPRLMNWLHAAFGIGATLGPLILTAVIRLNLNWRVGYGVAALLYGLALTCFFLTRDQWHVRTSTNGQGDASRVTAGDTLRLPAVWLGIGLFFLYGGLEVTSGQWSSSLFQRRGVLTEVAAIWVSTYWGSFTVGRIVFGFIADRFRLNLLIRGCVAGMLAGIFLLWANPTNEIGSIGLGLIGFSLAPIFALLVTNTQERLGPDYAHHAIGFQVAAASAGIAMLPGLAGVLANRISLEIVSPYLLVMGVGMWLFYEIISRSHAPQVQPTPALES
jgi:fucose permease